MTGLADEGERESGVGPERQALDEGEQDFATLAEIRRVDFKAVEVLPPSNVADHDLSHCTEIAYVALCR